MSKMRVHPPGVPDCSNEPLTGSLWACVAVGGFIQVLHVISNTWKSKVLRQSLHQLSLILLRRFLWRNDFKRLGMAPTSFSTLTRNQVSNPDHRRVPVMIDLPSPKSRRDRPDTNIRIPRLTETQRYTLLPMVSQSRILSFVREW